MPRQSLSPGGGRRTSQRLQPRTAAHSAVTQDPPHAAAVKAGETKAKAQVTMEESTPELEAKVTAQKSTAGQTGANSSEATTAEANEAAEGVPVLSTMADNRKADTEEAKSQAQVHHSQPAPKTDNTEEAPTRTEGKNTDNTEPDAPSMAGVEVTKAAPHTGPTPIADGISVVCSGVPPLAKGQ